MSANGISGSFEPIKPEQKQLSQETNSNCAKTCDNIPKESLFNVSEEEKGQFKDVSNFMSKELAEAYSNLEIEEYNYDIPDDFDYNSEYGYDFSEYGFKPETSEYENSGVNALSGYLASFSPNADEQKVADTIKAFISENGLSLDSAKELADMIKIDNNIIEKLIEGFIEDTGSSNHVVFTMKDSDVFDLIFTYM